MKEHDLTLDFLLQATQVDLAGIDGKHGSKVQDSS